MRLPSPEWSLVGVLGLTALAALLSLTLDLPTGSARDFVLTELRAPRVAMALVVGSTLGLVGAVFQTLFRNPLAAPSTLGTTAGATVGALFALALGMEGAWLLSAASLFAFVGAGAASSIVVSIAASGRARMEDVLLGGIAVTLAAGALSQALHTLADERQLFAAAHWALGQLPQVGFDRVLLALVPCVSAAAVLLGLGRALSVMSLGEPWARSMGVSTGRVRLAALIASCVGVGVVVGLSGPIAFVGLVVPHLCRPLARGKVSWLLWLSWVGGAGFLAASDLLARTLIPGRELPVGALTAGLGAPFLLFVIARRPRS